jgi:hemoglobin
MHSDAHFGPEFLRATCGTGFAVSVQSTFMAESPFVPLPVVTHPSPVPGAPNPHFERIGGEPVIRALVESFYAHMDTLPEARAIRRLHAKDLTGTKDVLVSYFVEWMGGPQRYTPERGHPRLRMRHDGVAIDESARDAWMLCMQRALADVVPDAALREDLQKVFYKVADMLVNRPRTP